MNKALQVALYYYYYYQADILAAIFGFSPVKTYNTINYNLSLSYKTLYLH